MGWRFMEIKGGVYHLQYSHNKKNYCFIFFLSNCSLPKEHFDIKYIYFFFNSTYGETEVDLHGEMWVMGFLHISAYRSITIKPKKKKIISFLHFNKLFEKRKIFLFCIYSY